MCPLRGPQITLQLAEAKTRGEKETCPSNHLKLHPASTDRVLPEIHNRAKIDSLIKPILMISQRYPI